MTLIYDSERARRELAAADPGLGRAIRRIGACGLEPETMQSPFEALARAIVYQQLSGKAAATILGRVEALFPRRELRPKRVLETPEDSLRGAGMSRAKVAAFHDLARKTLDGTVPKLAELEGMSDEEIVGRLVQVRGVGRWTVEMLLIFRLGRPDVMPASDLGVRKGYAVLVGAEELPPPSELLARTAHWAPWRSVASWYLWRICDGNP
jgi:DNA-3-methyladenine glycosylase II